MGVSTFPAMVGGVGRGTPGSCSSWARVSPSCSASPVSALEITVAAGVLGQGCFGVARNLRAEIQPRMQSCALPPGFVVPQVHCWLWASPGQRGRFCRLVSDLCKASVQAGAGAVWQVRQRRCVEPGAALQAQHWLPRPSPGTQPSSPSLVRGCSVSVLGRLMDLLGRDTSAL